MFFFLSNGLTKNTPNLKCKNIMNKIDHSALQKWHKGIYSTRVWFENIRAQGPKELLEVSIIFISFLL
jgi:hypothetical protein